MGKLQNAITFILSVAALILGGWLGYEIAGLLGVLVFAPLGALAGLLLGVLGWRVAYLLIVFQ